MVRPGIIGDTYAGLGRAGVSRWSRRCCAAAAQGRRADGARRRRVRGDGLAGVRGCLPARPRAAARQRIRAPAPATGSAARHPARTRCRRPGRSRPPPIRPRWRAWWLAQPEANVILATGRVFDVLDVPAAAGTAALTQMERSAVRPGPVAISAGNRALFFVLTRGAPADEYEWWSCHLDCEPEIVAAGGRAALALPGQLRAGARRPGTASAVRRTGCRPPDDRPLPDGVRLLEFLADVCEGSS